MKPLAFLAPLALLLGISFTALLPGVAGADCAMSEPTEAIRSADIVFVGTVDSLVSVEPDDGFGNPEIWRFSVDSIAKGDVGAFADVSYDNWHATLTGDVGDQVVVIAGSSEGQLFSYGCVASVSPDELTDIATLEGLTLRPGDVASARAPQEPTATTVPAETTIPPDGGIAIEGSGDDDTSSSSTMWLVVGGVFAMAVLGAGATLLRR